jgi:bud emergence protein 1
MSSTTLAPQKHIAFFAIVQYDFFAERPDELDAKAGEAISVVAQSNREWFVAKPIGRLGGPGLIPVSFVELREPQSGRKMTEAEVNECMDKGTLPRVEVWKKATLEYKQSSIPLGVIDPTPPPAFPPPNGYLKRSGSSGGRYEENVPLDPNAPEEDLLPPGLPIQASIPSFHQESGEYWFRLDVRYQPDPQDEYDETPPQQIAMVLYRNYDDFYAFQLDLLDTWPVEAGREKRDPNGPPLTEADRILPYMPGPVDNVDEAVTVERRADLDIYVHELVALAEHPLSADYILRCDLVRRFFSQKPGDVILPPPSPSAALAQKVADDPNRLRLNGLNMHDNGQRMSHASAYSDHKSQRSMRSHGNDLQNTVRLMAFAVVCALY